MDEATQRIGGAEKAGEHAEDESRKPTVLDELRRDKRIYTEVRG